MMMRSFTLIALAASSTVLAQRPSNTSICDYYSAGLLNVSNATTQYTLVTLLVNTAVIGNYTTPNKLAVPGILAQGAKYNDTPVNLLPYFDGGLASSNRGGSEGVAINFLDGGGAAPLKENKPSNSTTGNQFKLLTHLYAYFGILLGCSNISQPAFPAYMGQSSMYNVHKFMALDAYEVQYFIEQVGLSAASFGVATADIEYVGHALQEFFGFRCSPAVDIIPGQDAELQSICTESDCPESPNGTCKAYNPAMQPKKGTTGSTSTMPSSSGSSMPSSSMPGSSMPGISPTATASKSEGGNLIAVSLATTIGIVLAMTLLLA